MPLRRLFLCTSPRSNGLRSARENECPSVLLRSRPDFLMEAFSGKRWVCGKGGEVKERGGNCGVTLTSSSAKR